MTEQFATSDDIPSHAPMSPIFDGDAGVLPEQVRRGLRRSSAAPTRQRSSSPIGTGGGFRVDRA